MGKLSMVALLLTGCGASELAARQERSAEAIAAPPARAARVLLLDAETINRPTEALGLVDAHASSRTPQALDELRDRAAEMGADAVLGVSFHHGDGEEPAHLSGIAVRFRDLLQGRAYDVIARLEATAPMGHEEEAHADLRRRARDAGADLILNVRFEHGEGDARSVRVTGTAVRLRPM